MTHEEIVDKIRKLTASGKVKTKGAYEVLPFTELGWQKNHSAMVVPMASLAKLLGMCEVDKFITSHKDPFDFCLRTKVPRSSKLYLTYEDGREILQQNICRYYPSKSGGKLVKWMPGLKPGDDWRKLGIDVEWFVDTCNNIHDFKWNDVNYDYYIFQAQTLVGSVESNG